MAQESRRGLAVPSGPGSLQGCSQGCGQGCGHLTAERGGLGDTFMSSLTHGIADRSLVLSGWSRDIISLSCGSPQRLLTPKMEVTFLYKSVPLLCHILFIRNESLGLAHIVGGEGAPTGGWLPRERGYWELTEKQPTTFVLIFPVNSSISNLSP